MAKADVPSEVNIFKGVLHGLEPGDPQHCEDVAKAVKRARRRSFSIKQPQVEPNENGWLGLREWEEVLIFYEGKWDQYVKEEVLPVSKALKLEKWLWRYITTPPFGDEDDMKGWLEMELARSDGMASEYVHLEGKKLGLTIESLLSREDIRRRRVTIKSIYRNRGGYMPDMWGL